MVTHRPVGIALHTMATPDATVVEAIVLAAELGFEAIELICDEGYRCAITVSTPDAELDRVRRAADEHGIIIAGIVPYFRELNVLDRAERQRAIEGMKRAVDVAQRIGSRAARIFAGTEPLPESEAAQFALLVDSIRDIDDHAAGSVRLNVENHKGTAALSAAKTRSIIDAVGSPNVGIIFDPANLWRLGERDLRSAYLLQKDAIRHVHFKDVAAEPPYLPVPAGEGVVPWDTVLGDLSRDGYSGFVSAEYEKRWHPAILPSGGAALKHEAAFIRTQLRSSPAATLLG